MSNKGRGLSVILDRSSFLCSITIVLGVTSAGAGHYVAKVDLNNATGFDAVKATIEVVPVSILNTNGFSVWCGIDAGKTPAAFNSWLQAGWRWRSQGFPQHGLTGQGYYEYVTESLFQSYPVEVGDASTGSYGVERHGWYVDFYVGGLLEYVHEWEAFDEVKLCHAMYGAEVHADPIDHVPGTQTAHCHISNVQIRAYGNWFSAPFEYSLTSPDQPSCFGMTVSLNNMEIWDRRGLLQSLCP
jgi:hypothetical protein